MQWRVGRAPEWVESSNEATFTGLSAPRLQRGRVAKGVSPGQTGSAGPRSWEMSQIFRAISV
jgi:hypothetical protein